MTETKDKIIKDWVSIEKEKLFSLCDSDWKLARVQMTMIIHKALWVEIVEANIKARQLKSERESFYNLI